MKAINFLELFNKRTIRGKFFILTVSLTLIPMVLLSIVFYRVAVDKLGSRAVEQAVAALRMGNHYIQRLYVDLKDLMNVVLINSEIQTVLNGQDEDDYTYLNNLRVIQSSMSSITQNKSYITSYMLYSSNYEPDKRFYGSSNTYLSADQGEQLYETMLRKDGVNWWNNRSLDQFSQDSGKMIVGRVMRSTENDYEPIGYVLLEIDKYAFFEGIVFLKSGRDSHFFVLDNDGGLVHSLEDGEELGSGLRNSLISTLRTFNYEENTKSRVDGKHYRISSELISNMPWRFVYMIEESAFYADASFIQKVTIGAFLLFFLVGCVLAYAFSQAVSRPLKRLLVAIKRNASTDEELKRFDSRDEVGQMGIRFIHMIRENKALHNQMVQEAIQRKEAEIQVLQAQINPHFLYNTLDSLNWMALKNNQFQISEIVSSLGRFFRISISKGKQLIPVSDELEHVLTYLKVQRFRFNDSFDVVMEVEEEILPFLTPKLILQPIVENAVNHGLKPNDNVGTILISGRLEGRVMVFQVTDDGAGIEGERLEALRRSLDGDSDASVATYGMKNIHDRLRLRYGLPYGLHIGSEYGVYTTVTLTIPLLESKDEEADPNEPRSDR